MAARATWKGFLKISLVNIPIMVFPATESSGSISFNQLHAECQTRIKQKKWCPHCERDVPMSEIVKGFEFDRGRFVIMDDQEIEQVRPASTRVIDLCNSPMRPRWTRCTSTALTTLRRTAPWRLMRSR
jgi:DNA end-binding protein Ku